MAGRIGGRAAAAVLGLLLAGAVGVSAQEDSARSFAPNLVVPQARAFGWDRESPVQVTGVSASVAIVERVATTTLDVALENPSDTRQEAEVLLPVPEDAAVRSFTFQGAAAESEAKLLPRDEARRIYDEIVSKARDPALLEFAGQALIRSSVFPVEPRGTQRVRLAYEHVLPVDGNRFDYVLPRSEFLENAIPWRISVRVRTKAALAAVYSPSHRITATRKDDHEFEVSTEGGATLQPGTFVLSCLAGGEGVAASLLAYPDPKSGGGYFLLLAGLPPRPAGTPGEQPVRREVTLVLDRSGSMKHEKIEQVREAAERVLDGLSDGEWFNLIVYNEGVDLFSKGPVAKTAETLKAARDYLKGVEARGGTNLHDALLEALRQPPAEGALPLVLFLTDGLPTVGKTAETVIRELAEKHNPHKRRVFTFGVGTDVNTPLLERIATDTRAASTFVLPKEDVAQKMGQVFRRLSGPVLSEPALELVDREGKPALGRVRDLLPDRLPDLFDGDQLLLFGQYVGEAPLGFRLRGSYLGHPRTFAFEFPLDKATTRNAFVPRLWAARKIGVLVDAIRQAAAETKPLAPGQLPSDPALKELVDEVVRLSTEFGILTEYTAFLAREGTDLALTAENRSLAERAIGSRVRDRSGLSGINQEENAKFWKGQSCMNYANGYWDPGMNVVAVTTVQQVNDRAFYRKGNRWVDSRLAGNAPEPKRVVEFGSEAFRGLASKLASENGSGCVSLRGEILLVVDGEPVLVKNPDLAAAEPQVREAREQKLRQVYQKLAEEQVKR